MNNKIYKNLIIQLDRLAAHNRQGSYQTRRRYYEAMKRFCKFLANQYRVERLANIAPKHIFAYVETMQAQGKSAATIKTDLAAIRFFHDQMPKPRYRLPDNAAIGLERRSFGKVDRTWGDDEFQRMLEKAQTMERYDYVLAFNLARYAGLRIHECFRIDTATAEKALRENAITIKGKGGKIRTVPINKPIALALHKQLETTQRGHKLLAPDGIPTDHAIHQLQEFIIRYRPEVQDVKNRYPLTFHGLRHTFAAEKYQQLMESGTDALEARYAVSRLLGHNRADVVNVYLASIRINQIQIVENTENKECDAFGDKYPGRSENCTDLVDQCRKG